MIDSTTIVTTVRIIDIADVLEYITVCGIPDRFIRYTNDNLITLHSTTYTTDHYQITNDLLRYLVKVWFRDACGVSVSIKTISPIIGSFAMPVKLVNVVNNVLKKNMTGIDMSRHGRRIVGDVFLTNNSVHLIVRSCNEYN